MSEKLPDIPDAIKYTPEKFLQDVNRAWGGELYFGIRPGYENMDVALLGATLFGCGRNSMIGENSVNIGIAHLKKVLLSQLPHPDEAQNRIHLLADPFCRTALNGYIEYALSNVLAADTELLSGPVVITDEKSPVPLIEELFNTPLVLPTVKDYILRMRGKAAEYAARFGFDIPTQMDYIEELEKSMDRFAQYIKLIKDHHGDDLPFQIRSLCETIASFHSILN